MSALRFHKVDNSAGFDICLEGGCNRSGRYSILMVAEVEEAILALKQPVPRRTEAIFVLRGLGLSAGSTIPGRQLPAEESAAQLFETEPADVETRSTWTDPDVAEAA